MGSAIRALSSQRQQGPHAGLTCGLSCFSLRFVLPGRRLARRHLAMGCDIHTLGDGVHLPARTRG
jgi:hypothetical protein